MDGVNVSSVTKFILLGLSHGQDQITLFAVFLSTYFWTLVDNSLIIFIINKNQRLNSPMFFFLGNLSFIDICFSSVTLADVLREWKTITFRGCMSQLFFLYCPASMECFVLAVTAYGRLVAISNFLHDLLVFTEGSLATMRPSVFVVVSNRSILKIILMMRSSTGRYQAFSTCSSHLTSVGLFFGTVFFTYFRPSSSNSEDDRSVTVVFSILTSLLNPFIYSLRNKQVKNSLKIFSMSLHQ